MQNIYPYDDIRYCTGCKKKHAVTINSAWDHWNTKQIGKKTINYCETHIDCIGCKSIHPKTPYMQHCTKTHPETGESLSGWWCEKWVKPAPLSMEKIIEGLSPQEVVSGVQYGMERQEMWGKDSEDFSVERARQLPELEEALSE